MLSNKRHRALALAALPIVAAGLVAAAIAWQGGLSVEPLWRATAVCPQSFDASARPDPSFRLGDLVPEGATAATLCVYAPPEPSSDLDSRPAMLTSTRPIEGEVDDLTAYLNSLPADTPVNELITPGVCNSMATASYQIVVAYDDGSLLVSFGCGVWQGDGLRRLKDLNRMRALFGLTGPPTLEG